MPHANEGSARGAACGRGGAACVRDAASVLPRNAAVQRGDFVDRYQSLTPGDGHGEAHDGEDTHEEIRAALERCDKEAEPWRRLRGDQREAWVRTARASTPAGQRAVNVSVHAVPPSTWMHVGFDDRRPQRLDGSGKAEHGHAAASPSVRWVSSPRGACSCPGAERDAGAGTVPSVMETREAFDAQCAPTGRRCWRTRTACWATSPTPKTWCRRRWCERGSTGGRSRGAPACARGRGPSARAALTRAERTARRELPGLRDDEPSHSVDVGAPSPEVPWLEPMPDAWLGGPLDERESPEAQVTRRQSVALAFLAALQLLPPLQRAALLLTAVLAWSAAEVAEALETTVPAVNSALQRARQTLELKVPHWSASRPSAAAAVSAKYVDAWTRGDADALAALLRDDVTLAMPPFSAWFSGRADVVAFLRHFMAMAGPWEARVCEGFNGALAVELRSPSGLPPALHLVTLDDHGAIASTMVFVGRVGAAPPSPAG